MLRTFSVILFAACIASLSSTGWACSCFPVSFDQRICLAQTTLEGTVLARSDNCPGTCDPIGDQAEGRISYIVRADKVIAGEAPEDGLMYLKTMVNSALCGIELTVGQKYLFTLDGMQTDMKSCPRNFWDINLCSFPKAVSSLTADEVDLINKLTSGVVSCKDGRIDSFGTMPPASVTEEPVPSMEASAEPAELVTFKRRADAGDMMMEVSAEPMLSAEATEEPLELLTFERQMDEDEMMMMMASAEPMVSAEPSAEPVNLTTSEREVDGSEIMMAASAEPMVSAEATEEPLELLTFERQMDDEDEMMMMMASVEPMVSAESSAEPLKLLTSERHVEEDGMMAMHASSEPAAEESPAASMEVI